ncbi:MAG: alpha/beta fold hydrolase [Trueperaceae bacterium]
MIRPYPSPQHRPFAIGSSRNRALLIHGFPGTPWELRSLAKLLAEQGYEAHCPLLPGFGPQIDSLGDRSWQDWEESVHSAFGRVRSGAAKLLVVGYSMGAALAVRLAAHEEVDELVLINPFSGLSLPVKMLLPVLAPLVPSYRPFRSANFEDPWTREVVGRVLPDLDVDDLTSQERLRNEVRLPVRAITQVQRLGSAAWRAAPRVRARTLVFQGVQDKVVSATRTRRFAGRLGARAQLREAPGGHVLIWPGKPGHGELVRELGSFLSDGVLQRSG